MDTQLLIAFVVLAFLCALALAFSRWPVWAKLILVGLTTALYFYGTVALESVWGWPSKQSLPERFTLLAAMIEEPSGKGPGALYVWVQPLQDGKPISKPRAYELPYTKDLHSMLTEGMKKVRQGVSQVGTAEPKRGPKGFSWLKPGSEEQTVKIRDIPVPQLPEK